jgi:hypothetical protein
VRRLHFLEEFRILETDENGGGAIYVDKPNFIKEWWESGDAVTLIARPQLDR